jgi:hypothetical protein
MSYLMIIFICSNLDMTCHELEYKPKFTNMNICKRAEGTYVDYYKEQFKFDKTEHLVPVTHCVEETKL